MVAADGGSQREWPWSNVWKDTKELSRQGSGENIPEGECGCAKAWSGTVCRFGGKTKPVSAESMEGMRVLLEA